jgi:hypothetical protein
MRLSTRLMRTAQLASTARETNLTNADTAQNLSQVSLQGRITKITTTDSAKALG